MMSANEKILEFVWPQDDITDEEWRLFVARSLRDELNDPEEDIYSLDDGVPPDTSTSQDQHLSSP